MKKIRMIKENDLFFGSAGDYYEVDILGFVEIGAYGHKFLASGLVEEGYAEWVEEEIKHHPLDEKLAYNGERWVSEAEYAKELVEEEPEKIEKIGKNDLLNIDYDLDINKLNDKLNEIIEAVNEMNSIVNQLREDVDKLKK